MSSGIELSPLAQLFQSFRSVCRRPTLTSSWLPLLLTCCLLSPLHAAEPGLDRDCVLRLAETGEDAMTLADIRQACRAGAEEEKDPDATVSASWLQDDAAETGLVERRLEADRKAASRPFSIMAHKPNYFLAAAYNSKGWSADVHREETGDAAYSNDDLESQFQVSLKVPLAVGLMGDRLDLYGAYTNRSFWQVYNRENSEPFRETNHEPEVWLQFRNDWSIFGFTNSVNTVGWVHQSKVKAGCNRAVGTGCMPRWSSSGHTGPCPSGRGFGFRRTRIAATIRISTDTWGMGNSVPSMGARGTCSA